MQALPHLIEADDENAEAACHRFYAYALAQRISKTAPQLWQTIDRWKNNDTTGLMDTLQNPVLLKHVLPEETPWVLAATPEIEQRSAAFFDTTWWQAMQKSSLDTLKSFQNNDGSFAWFPGGPPDRFITQAIVTAIGRLKKLAAVTNKNELHTLLKPALYFLDSSLAVDYKILKLKTGVQNKVFGPLQIQYLYLRSFFPDIAILPDARAAYRFYQQQAQQFWKSENQNLQGLIALALHRNGDVKTPLLILQSLKRSISAAKQKVAANLLQLWQNQVEEKTVLLEAFQEIGKDTNTINVLLKDLLAEKNAAHWYTKMAAAAACYALLLQDSNPDDATLMQVKIGNTFFSNKDNSNAIAGYFKKQ